MNKFLFLTTFYLLILHPINAQDWVRIMDGPQSKNPSKILTLSNGDLLIGGIINDPAQYYQSSGLLTRTDANGNLLWEKRIGNTDAEGNYSANERIEGMALTSDGNVVLVGNRTPPTPNSFAASDILIAKYDLEGNELWRRYYDWGKTDNAYGVVALPAGEFIVCGNTNSFSNDIYEGVLFKMSPSGDILWRKQYNTGSVPDYLYGLTLTNDQHLMAVGTSETTGAGNRTLVIKTDLEGTLIWEKTYPEYAIKGHAIVQNKNGQYGIGGQGFSNSGSFDMLIMEINGNGQVLWGRNYNVAGSVPDELYDILPCNEGGYTAVGLSGVNPFDGYQVIRVDASGNVVKTLTLYDGAPDIDFAKSLTGSADGGIVVTGARLKPDGDYDQILTHFSDLGCTQVSMTAITEASALHVNISPNPIKDFILINAANVFADQYLFTLYDAFGKQALSHSSSQPIFNVYISDTPSGVYFYTLQLSNGQVAKGKLFIER